MKEALKKAVELVTSRESTESLVKRVTDNPRTTRWGAVLAAGFGAAIGLNGAGFVLAGYLVGGATVLLAIGVQVFGRDPSPPGGA